LWNFAFASFIIYQLYIDNPYSSTQSERNRYKQKPFLKLLNQLNGRLFYYYIDFTIIYFSIMGPKLVENIKELTQICEESLENLNRVFLLTLIGANLVFVIAFYTTIFLSYDGFTLRNVFRVITIYVNFYYQFLPLFLVHYSQYLTYREMVYLTESRFILKMKTIANKIKSIVLVNQIIHSQLSLPLTFLIASNTIDWIQCICLSGLDTEWTYFVYVANGHWPSLISI